MSYIYFLFRGNPLYLNTKSCVYTRVTTNITYTQVTTSLRLIQF